MNDNAKPIPNVDQWLAGIDKNPGRPAAPNADANTLFNPIHALPTALPTIAPQNGYLSLKLTPNIAGSVIPNNAEIPDADEIDFIFVFLENTNTARTAAPCATLDIDAIGKINVNPVAASN